MDPESEMDSKSLAHDLNANVWRSEDVKVSTYLNHSDQIEIKTPFQDDPEFFLKNTENTTFALLHLNEQIVEDLKRCGFVTPSPIQTTCIPLGRLGIDLIAQSKSGTGKTMVFVLCALEMIVDDLLNDVPQCAKVLIVAPTREIAVQIGDIIDSLMVNWKNFSCFKAIGGTKVCENITKLYGSQIVVGTPGRICCLLEMDFLKPHSIRLFVLDECDKLMEENFRKQIDKIYNRLPLNKQMIVTSATMSTEMTEYLSKYMRDPALIRLNADQPSLIGVMQYILQVEGHCLDYMNFEQKIVPLIYILKHIQFNQCFIFLNYQTRVKYLYEKLNSESLSVTYITGDMSQKERLHTIDLFRKQKFKIFISTDLTSRGIDIESVNLVINVDIPFDCETYLHRVGRSGRFGSSGIAITIVGKEDERAKFHSTIAAYNLQIKELDLQSIPDLWNVFYQERSETLSRTSAAGTLKINPIFEKMESIYHQLLNQSTETSDLCAKKSLSWNLIQNADHDHEDSATSSTSSYNFITDLEQISKNLQSTLQQLITSATAKNDESPTTMLIINEDTDPNVPCSSEILGQEKIPDSDHDDDSDSGAEEEYEDKDEVISLQPQQHETTITTRSIENPSKYPSSTTTMKNDSIVSKVLTTNARKPEKCCQSYWPSPPPSSSSLSMIDPTKLFRQTFLNNANMVFKHPPFPFTKITANQHHYDHNVIICRYLLKGGKF